MNLKFPYLSKRILAISDMHMPYEHPDAIPFLKAVKRKYEPQLTISVGDLGDHHDLSFHKSEPGLVKASQELSLLQNHCRELAKIFPKLLVTVGNHDEIPKRRLIHEGMPTELLKTYAEIYGVPKGWDFVGDITIKDQDSVLYVVHGVAKNGKALASQRGVCVIQGHYHTEARIDYVSTPRNLLWSMQVGCLIDRTSLAFAYDKLNLNRPIISVGVVINGTPHIEPMLLKEGGRWAGKLS